MWIDPRKGEFWIRDRKEGKKVYLKNLGRVSREEAEHLMEEYKRLLILKANVPMPKGEFDIIYADPPWQYESAVDNRKIENHYPTMAVDEICALKVPSAKDSILFLWATAPKLIEAVAVVSAWGFEYKTGAVWDKKRTGMGYYFRGQHEHLLVGRKGNPGVPKPGDRLPSVIESVRARHSEKPDIVYEMIEKMYPDRRYLELFARRQFNERWTVWGNEV